MNAREVLVNIDKMLEELEAGSNDYEKINFKRVTYSRGGLAFKIRSVYDELGIFDWWNETLSKSQLNQMKSFLNTAIKLGFDKYVCFKVGAAGCSHGMWAHTEESKDGYSPKSDFLFHSFRSGDNYYDASINGKMMWEYYKIPGNCYDGFTLADVKKFINETRNEVVV